jgi:hypothetical protein
VVVAAAGLNSGCVIAMSTSPPVLHDKLPLLEVREPCVLAQILADPVAATCLATRLSDRVAVVVPRRMDVLRERLLKLGHLPRVTAAG